MYVVFGAAWLMAVIYASIPCYWFMVHPFAEFWRQRRSPLRVIVLLWALIILSLAAITWPWHSVSLYASLWALLPALAFIAMAISVYRRMPSQFGVANFSGQAELDPQAQQRLVTSGMHARVRHPVYLAHLCTLLAFTVGSGLAVDYTLLAFALVTGCAMIALEEHELERRFGDEWNEYKRRTGAIFPRISPQGLNPESKAAPLQSRFRDEI